MDQNWLEISAIILRYYSDIRDGNMPESLINMTIFKNFFPSYTHNHPSK